MTLGLQVLSVSLSDIWYCCVDTSYPHCTFHPAIGAGISCTVVSAPGSSCRACFSLSAPGIFWYIRSGTLVGTSWRASWTLVHSQTCKYEEVNIQWATFDQWEMKTGRKMIHPSECPMVTFLSHSLYNSSEFASTTSVWLSAVVTSSLMCPSISFSPCFVLQSFPNLVPWGHLK